MSTVNELEELLETNMYSMGILALGYIFVLLLLVYLIFKPLNRAYKKNSVNRVEKAIALAITALFFSQTIYLVAVSPVYKTIVNLQTIFVQLSNGFSAYRGYNPDMMSAALQNMNIARAASFAEVFTPFPLRHIIIAIGFFVITYKLILSFKERNAYAVDAGGVQTNQNIFYNSIILGVLAFSLFLVVSVFITIPYLGQIGKPSIFTVDNLKSDLTKIASRDSFRLERINTDLKFGSNLPHEFTNDTTVHRQLFQMSADDRSSVMKSLEAVKYETNNLNEARSALVEQIRAYGNNYHNDETTFQQKLVTNFSNRAQSISTDKGELYQVSLNALEMFVREHSRYFYNTLQKIRSIDQNNIDEYQMALSRLKQRIESIDARADTSELLNVRVYYPSAIFEQYPEFRQGDNFNYLMPPEQKHDGSEWGIFGFIAKYLIETQSLELVLLMGMFGFGLLGASIFSFEHTDNFVVTFRTRPLIKNFANVLIRGFGAALVVYMATKGGLAIFTRNEESDPNGYVLLLTCFVGAVYSEKVWTRVSNQLYGPKDTVPADKKDKKDGTQDSK